MKNLLKDIGIFCMKRSLVILVIKRNIHLAFKYKASLVCIVMALFFSTCNLFAQCSPPVTTGNSGCNSGTYKLKASSSAAEVESHYWYTSPVGGISIGPITQGPNPIGGGYTSTYESSFNSDQTFYVEAKCKSGGYTARTPVTFDFTSDAPVYITYGNGAPGAACAGNGFYLHANGGSFYEWTLNASFKSNLPDYSPTESGTYTLKGTNSCGIVKYATIAVTVIPTQPYPPTFYKSVSSVNQGSSPSTFAASSNVTDITYSISNAGNSSMSNGIVTWDPAFFGVATVTATAKGCSGITASTNTNVTVIMTALPPNNYNYIRTNTLLKEGTTDVNSVNFATLGVDKLSQSTTYFDGLGRPVQTVQTQGTRNYKDIVQPVIYDKFERDTVKYLPYVSSENNGYYKVNAVGAENNTYSTSPQYLFYQNAANVAHDTKPYAVSVYEKSPLNKLKEQGAEGAIWQPGTPQNATIKIDYQVNSLNEVLLWKYIPGSGDAFGSIQYVKAYNAGNLYKTSTTDEHANLAIEFKNKEGQVVLKKIQNGTQYLFTYYIYDDLNQLRAVIPPQGFAELPALTANYTLTKDFLNKWCFTYQYDSRNRMTEKKVPGAGKVVMLYDKRDRLVLTQDSVQRVKNEWLYTKYDAFNRAVITGKHIDSRSKATIQGLIDAQSTLFEIRDTVTIGYSLNKCFPSNADTSKVISITFYDDYDFLGRRFWDNRSKNYIFSANDVVSSSAIYTNVNGLSTGTKTRVFKKKNWEYTVRYYDDNARVIQEISKNYSGGLDINSHQYDFTGKALTSKLAHTGVENATILQTFEYDHAGRLLKAYHQVGTDASKKVLLAENKYNELGQLIDKGLGVKNNVALQSVDFRYNIRGWLTSINNSALSNDGTLNDDSNDVFGMELLYEKPLGITGLGLNDFKLPPYPLKGELLPTEMRNTTSVFSGIAGIAGMTKYYKKMDFRALYSDTSDFYEKGRN